MAGDWLKWVKGLANKREVLVMSAQLGRDRHEVAGRLMALWEWCDDNITESEIDDAGNAMVTLGALPERTIDAIAGVTGFAQAMADAQWLRLANVGATFPNFARHNGQTSKTRALTAKRVAEHKRQGNAKGNAASVSDALPREEKRRVLRKKERKTHMDFSDVNIRDPRVTRGYFARRVAADPCRWLDPLNEITPETVADNRGVAVWFERQSACQIPAVDGTLVGLVAVLAAGMAARQNGTKSKAGLFRKIVEAGNWASVAGHIEHAAEVAFELVEAGVIGIAHNNAEGVA